MHRILLVDDSAISRMMLRAIIEENFDNVSIVEADCAETASEMCSTEQFEYITLDMNMPGQDGLTAAPILQEKCPNARIVLLTANFQERVKSKALSLNLDFFEKPITLDKVQSFLTF